MPATQPGSGSTVRRILLGSQLRRLREAKGITREEAGYEIRASESKISRMELGRVSFKDRDVADLLTMYGVVDETERAALQNLAAEANAQGWWHNYNDILPSWFQVYVGLEEAASVIRTYEVQFVPGLLQTREYARAVVIAGQPSATNAEVDRRVGLRMQRQSILYRDKPPRLWVVLDEAALRRPIGGRDVMRDQVRHLIEMAALPNVTIQIMPFRFGAHAAEGGPFLLLRFPESDLPDVVYLEQLTSALYLDKRDEVDAYTEVMDRLSVDGMPPDKSVDLLQRILKEN
ncbi:helix-turn-helix transcriptional regulator [Streptomyces sp. SID3343]|uniref:helix-turn-helix domain-containing protein n=1 Tax=Streptomyces sp. SID3343 TaxID=2690260 RepID=UPI00136A1392|nr:helix-turn-helix transcriptional regulator [Streptomyces sp. SID3343]MYW00860.1 helix-turn-helix domain-containing protein [Streptomyces sp. SID3343]